MRQPSLAEKALETCRTIAGLAHELHSDDKALCRTAFQQMYASLGALEEIARRRVDVSTYENHRRAMEACHVTIPRQVIGG
jgi:hypothetical protein